MLRYALCAAAALTVAAPALAGNAASVTLDKPVADFERFVAADAVWDCSGNTCTAELKTKKAKVKHCKEVAAEVGAVATYTAVRGELPAEELAECNAAAKAE